MCDSRSLVQAGVRTQQYVQVTWAPLGCVGPNRRIWLESGKLIGEVKLEWFICIPRLNNLNSRDCSLKEILSALDRQICISKMVGRAQVKQVIINILGR